LIKSAIAGKNEVVPKPFLGRPNYPPPKKKSSVFLMREEQGIKEIYMIQKRKCIHKKESERCDTSGY
jgi:hypothetical protein